MSTKSRKNSIKIIMFAFCCTLIASCSTPPTKQQIGLVTGGVAGAAVGSLFGGGSGKVIATGVGAVGGAFIGSEIGKSMDQKSQQNTTVAMNNGLYESSWNQKGNTYTIKPGTAMYVNNQGLVCRNFEATLNNGQNNQLTQGTACQDPKTTAWNVV